MARNNFGRFVVSELETSGQGDDANGSAFSGDEINCGSGAAEGAFDDHFSVFYKLLPIKRYFTSKNVLKMDIIWRMA